mmetsp:Transcript_63652/g.125863  ORF Transcript_63652/g.125863 Transcript_63652/m.125863 type:complete len:252 (-) Transcript_63652:1459-2214(-)
MDRLCAEELERVVDVELGAVGRVLGALGVESVVHKHSGHHRVGRLLLEDFKLKVGHAAVSPCEGLVVDNADGGGRGCHHRGDCRAGLELNLSAPVLHALGEGVVGALSYRQAVDELNGLPPPRLHRLVEVLDEELATREHVGDLLEPHRAKAHTIVRAGGGVGFAGAHMNVGRRAEEGDAGARSRLAESLDAIVRAEGKLDVKVAVEVGVVADHDLSGGGQRRLPGAEPVGDLARLLHQVASRVLMHIVIV